MNYDKFLQIFSIGTLCVLFGLMTLGGYVSSSGVGLSCPHWPLCPHGLIPSYEFLIEYIHRTTAASTGLLVFLTMIFVLRGKHSLKSTKMFSIIAAAAVVGQITLGAIVINEKLHADLVTAHLGLGLVLYSSMIYVVINIFYTNLKLKSSLSSSKSSRGDNSNTPEVSSPT
ncbi:Heme A synthase [Candidatus Nitrosocosmicus oleophilus]|jgi:heme A synthase|uniref:Heme A synthase n=1 Tax=Candidatus Nitrosocosmicus oleophilus TaxID=1353260 RepID=A0A654LVH7_9ARCH|nr:COX15/CtaA family protein [Candidatus Nitrosocosmicus oleophilus]ALI35464.1 Heme A synthase [Candidatus Nitrosocosmicus oleophilus]